LTVTLRGANHIHLRLDDGTIDMDGTITFERPPPSQMLGGYAPFLILKVRGGSADGVMLAFAIYA